jgi:serine protease Do
MTHFRFLLTLFAITLASPVFADPASRTSIARLFTKTATKASQSTVSVRCNNKPTILGTIIEANGYILTKGTELRGGPISVRLEDGSEYDAKYVGYHEPTDLALLQVEATDLKPISGFAEGKDAKVGNWICVTNFEGEPLSAGIVSAGVRRLYGEESIIDNLNKGFLGITAPANESAASEGVTITSIAPGGGAELARLKVDDVILSVAGRSVKKFDDLKKILDKYKPGESVKVVIRRKDEEKEINVKLVAKAKIDRGDYQNTLSGDLSARRTGFPMVITHDAVIKPSECGGPLLDLDGKILGINIARAGRVETWALPAEIIKPIYEELKARKHPAPKDDTEKK